MPALWHQWHLLTLLTPWLHGSPSHTGCSIIWVPIMIYSIMFTWNLVIHMWFTHSGVGKWTAGLEKRQVPAERLSTVCVPSPLRCLMQFFFNNVSGAPDMGNMILKTDHEQWQNTSGSFFWQPSRCRCHKVTASKKPWVRNSLWHHRTAALLHKC